MTIPNVLGKAEGIFGIAIALFVTATTLLVLKFIDPGTWASFVQWTWASVIGGAAAAAYRK